MRRSPGSQARPVQRERVPHRHSWEDAYGMTLDDIVRFAHGAPPSVAWQDEKRAQEQRRINGGTTSATPVLHATRLAVGERELVLVTVAMYEGGYRMVAFEAATHVGRQLWQSKGISRRGASGRHYSGVQQLMAKLGARIVQDSAPRKLPAAPEPEPIVTSFDRRNLLLWSALRMRLMHETDHGVEPALARHILGLLEEGHYPEVVVEMLDASRVPFPPLADAASSWLRLLGYDLVHAFVPHDDKPYASQLLQWDAEVLGA